MEGLQSRGVFADFCAGVRECSLLDLTLVGSGAGDAPRAAPVKLGSALRCIFDAASQHDCRGKRSRRALGFELPLAEFGEGDSQRTWA